MTGFHFSTIVNSRISLNEVCVTDLFFFKLTFEAFRLKHCFVISFLSAYTKQELLSNQAKSNITHDITVPVLETELLIFAVFVGFARLYKDLRRKITDKHVCLAFITIGTFRSEDEDDYEYEFSVLSMRIRFGGRHFSKCASSEKKTRTGSRPRPPI